MKKLLLCLCLILVSCTSKKETENKYANSQRDIAQNDSEFERPERKEYTRDQYYSRRGDGHAKFNYDNYEGQLGKALGSVFSRGNIKFMGVASGLRQNLFEYNLFDTGSDNPSGVNCEEIMSHVHRTPMGRCYFHNQLGNLSERDKQLASDVMMGSFNQRFGRNTSNEESNRSFMKDMMTPNPLEISQKLFARKDGKTKEAAVINVLASAWLQAMNHDWFTHGKNSKSRSYQVPGHESHPHFKDGMTVPATRSETSTESRLDDRGYNYVSRNQVTHWWDASQIYGSDIETIRKVRSAYNNDGSSKGVLLAEGKIAVDEVNKRLIYDQNGLPITGFHDNWWVGLELIHTLFHLEHNYIIDNILKPEIGKSLCLRDSKLNCGDELFEKARMINSALIAKIHTAEWTPALLDNSTLHLGMRANWFGFKEAVGIKMDNLRKLVNQQNDFKSIIHLLSGLVGESTLNLYSVPFTLTEEFVAVYRMHPLIPENITFQALNERGRETGAKQTLPIGNMLFRNAPTEIKKHNMTDWFYSFGTSSPGAMTLHNYPTFMTNMVAERNTGTRHSDSVRMDMGAIDVFRDRERGVPRYNDFRKALGLPPAKDFTDLIAGPAVLGGKAREISAQQAEDIRTMAQIYNNDIDKVDLLVGTLAETDRYPGFAFGNTPFYIFALMASRRLMVDPFFSDYFTDEYYTKNGIKHVQKQRMVDVLIRHYPRLRPHFYKKHGRNQNVRYLNNAFRPWGKKYVDLKRQLNAN